MKEDIMIVKRIAVLGVLVSLILLGCSVNELGVTEPDYFPLDEGNTWVYDVHGEEVSTEYTMVCEMFELEPGVYGWNTSTQVTHQDNPGIMAANGPEDTEPFDDSAQVVVDSALYVPGWGLIIPIDAKDCELYSVETPAGTFDNCILIQGEEVFDGIRFDIWLAPGVGPVHLSKRSNGIITKEILLREFLPAR
jgi:hypothetical protein